MRESYQEWARVVKKNNRPGGWGSHQNLGLQGTQRGRHHLQGNQTSSEPSKKLHQGSKVQKTAS